MICSLNKHVLIFIKYLNFILGSLLVAAAKFGGHVIGTDIDYLMLHGRTRPTRKQTRVIDYLLFNY